MVEKDEKIEQLIASHTAVINKLMEENCAIIARFAATVKTALQQGNVIFFLGNGGSASDSQHLAAEFVGRFQKERRGLPAIALTTDTSILTAVGNDYGFEQIFARQVEALVKAGDVVVGLSTSGNSPNVIAALKTAAAKGAVTIGMTGSSGGQMANICDLCVKVSSDTTARIQEAHILVGHIVCELTEEALGV
jgi:D-sedoheptulose 7-phosphate isomerase